jgi:hypothetical protein
MLAALGYDAHPHGDGDHNENEKNRDNDQTVHGMIPPV